MVWKSEMAKPDANELFRPTNREDIKRLTIGTFGLTDSGKTHFGLTGPPPVFVVDTEYGVDEVINRKGSPFISKEKGGTADEDKDIRVAHVLVANEENEVDLTQSLRLAEAAVESIAQYALQNPEPRGTIVIDTGSEIWGWYGLWLEDEGATRFTAKGDMMRTEWGKVNKPYTKLMYQLILSKWNVIITGKTREKYTKGGEPMGIYTGRWQKDTEHWLQVVFEARHMGTHREFRYIKNRLGDSLKLSPLRDPTFDDVFLAVIGRSYEEKQK